MVCHVGSCIPLHSAVPRGSRVGEATADFDAARVVHASLWPDPCVCYHDLHATVAGSHTTRVRVRRYEWNFDDVNPPVHAWAAMRVYKITQKYVVALLVDTVHGVRWVGWDSPRVCRSQKRADVAFLERVFHKLMLNFTWWVNRKDSEGKNLFEGGFLGLDNIGVFDRGGEMPSGMRLEQADGTAWMGMYCLNMLDIALELALHNRSCVWPCAACNVVVVCWLILCGTGAPAGMRTWHPSSWNTSSASLTPSVTHAWGCGIPILSSSVTCYAATLTLLMQRTSKSVHSRVPSSHDVYLTG